MRYCEMQFSGAEVPRGENRGFYMTHYEGRHCAKRRKRSVDVEICKSVGCFMALVIGVTFFILSYL